MFFWLSPPSFLVLLEKIDGEDKKTLFLIYTEKSYNKKWSLCRAEFAFSNDVSWRSDYFGRMKNSALKLYHQQNSNTSIDWSEIFCVYARDYGLRYNENQTVPAHIVVPFSERKGYTAVNILKVFLSVQVNQKTS
jgi:hypothetical protein